MFTCISQVHVANTEVALNLFDNNVSKPAFTTQMAGEAQHIYRVYIMAPVES